MKNTTRLVVPRSRVSSLHDVAEMRCDHRCVVGSVWRQFFVFSSSRCFFVAQLGRLGVLGTIVYFFLGISIQASLEIGFDLRRRVGVAFFRLSQCLGAALLAAWPRLPSQFPPEQRVFFRMQADGV